MNIEQFRNYCLAKSGTTESFPFDDKALTFKVMSKMYCITDVDQFESANLKCNPERAVELREQYSGIIGGYHMNKKHWNTVSMDGSVPDELIFELIDLSYFLVVKGLKKSEREELEKLSK